MITSNWPHSYLEQYARTETSDTTKEKHLARKRQNRRFVMQASGPARHDKARIEKTRQVAISKGQKIGAFWEKSEAQELREIFEEVKDLIKF